MCKLHLLTLQECGTVETAEKASLASFVCPICSPLWFLFPKMQKSLRILFFFLVFSRTSLTNGLINWGAKVLKIRWPIGQLWNWGTRNFTVAAWGQSRYVWPVKMSVQWQSREVVQEDWLKIWTDKSIAQEDGLNTGTLQRLASMDDLHEEPTLKRNCQQRQKNRNLKRWGWLTRCIKKWLFKI